MADPHPLSRGQRLLLTVGALAALVVLVGGTLLVLQGGRETGAGEASPGPAGPGQAGPSVTDRGTAPAEVRGAAATRHTPRARSAAQRPVSGVPQRIVVPALGVDAEVDPIDLTGTTLVPPGDVHRVGWWAQGARPGARTGAALLTGHTVHDGGGVFDLLDQLAPADRVRVGFGRPEITYAVRSVRSLSTEELARRSERLFRQDGPGRLVLVTCTDWDGEAYRGSTVVVATPARNLS